VPGVVGDDARPAAGVRPAVLAEAGDPGSGGGGGPADAGGVLLPAAVGRGQLLPAAGRPAGVHGRPPGRDDGGARPPAGVGAVREDDVPEGSASRAAGGPGVRAGGGGRGGDGGPGGVTAGGPGGGVCTGDV